MINLFKAYLIKSVMKRFKLKMNIITNLQSYCNKIAGEFAFEFKYSPHILCA